MKTVERFASLSLLALLTVLPSGGCGFANGLGVPHLLYQDDIALCRSCTEDDQICVERSDGSLGCSDFSQLNWCNAAANLFFQFEAEGPYVTVERGKGEWQDGFRSDCPNGQNAYVVEALVFDKQDDIVVKDGWDASFDPPEDGDLVALIDADQNVYPPTSWDSQVFTSTTGADTAYSLEVVFCLSLELDAPVALQITDDAGHHSNPVCFAAP